LTGATLIKLQVILPQSERLQDRPFTNLPLANNRSRLAIFATTAIFRTCYIAGLGLLFGIVESFATANLKKTSPSSWEECPPSLHLDLLFGRQD
jgi:hypothetical protein